MRTTPNVALPDEQVLAQSLVEPAWFAILVGRYEKAFLRKAYKVLRNREDAEDVVQETFTKIYLYATRFHEVAGASFRSWAYTILLNNARTMYQKRKQERDRFVTMPTEVFEALAPKAVREESLVSASKIPEEEPFKERVASLLTQLPKTLSRVSRLAFLEGRRYQAIADEEGISVSAVKMRVHRAKKLLRELSANTEFEQQYDRSR